MCDECGYPDHFEEKGIASMPADKPLTRAQVLAVALGAPPASYQKLASTLLDFADALRPIKAAWEARTVNGQGFESAIQVHVQFSDIRKLAELLRDFDGTTPPPPPPE